MDQEILARVRELLIGLNESPEGLELLGSLKHTAKFDPLPPEAEDSLKELEDLMKLVFPE